MVGLADASPFNFKGMEIMSVRRGNSEEPFIYTRAAIVTSGSISMQTK